ncbi:MAG: hypothetical protein IKM67_02690 [Clostridia bacterium]|nr:hypothetical protein [Clostridia bacterium]MBR3865604.1 hypothetical protein [Clostridia bacterium]
MQSQIAIHIKKYTVGEAALCLLRLTILSRSDTLTFAEGKYFIRRMRISSADGRFHILPTAKYFIANAASFADTYI